MALAINHPPYPEGYLLEGKVKPITEEQRQELIEFILAAQESMGGNEPVNPNKFDIEKMTPGVFEIALASLTAEAKYARPFGTDGETLIQCDAEHEEAIPLYTAPPVTVIKLPDWSQVSPDGLLDINADLARYHYGEEIKRLNGLEQS